MARREPFEHREHGVSRPDPYHWMRHTTPELLAHLAAERGFYDSACAHLHSLVSTLRAEMVSRLPACRRLAGVATYEVFLLHETPCW